MNRGAVIRAMAMARCSRPHRDANMCVGAQCSVHGARPHHVTPNQDLMSIKFLRRVAVRHQRRIVRPLVKIIFIRTPDVPAPALRRRHTGTGG